MTLLELKTLLSSHAGALFRLRLPDGAPVPLSFHITEVGRVHKTFLDCGGTLRETVTCQLQVWVGEDFSHRIETGKMAAILEKARACLPDESVPVEIEYGEQAISRYLISGAEILPDAVVLTLEPKRTECLAPELCGVPPRKSGARSFAVEPLSGSRCAPGGNCC